MRKRHFALTAASVLAIAAGTALIWGGGKGQALASAEADVDDGAYRLAVSGREVRCLLWPGRQTDGLGRSLELSAECEGQGSPLANARLWIESPDGGVVLADANGATLVEFAVSDGAAYESFRPAEPMMTLSALR